jgi:hypothetical protein
VVYSVVPGRDSYNVVGCPHDIRNCRGGDYRGHCVVGVGQHCKSIYLAPAQERCLGTH